MLLIPLSSGHFKLPLNLLLLLFLIGIILNLLFGLYSFLRAQMRRYLLAQLPLVLQGKINRLIYCALIMGFTRLLCKAHHNGSSSCVYKSDSPQLVFLKRMGYYSAAHLHIPSLWPKGWPNGLIASISPGAAGPRALTLIHFPDSS